MNGRINDLRHSLATSIQSINGCIVFMVKTFTDDLFSLFALISILVHFSLQSTTLRNDLKIQWDACFSPTFQTRNGKKIMSHRNSTVATPADYSQSIDGNLKELGDRRFDVATLLSRPTDWCLLDFLNEFNRRGCIEENVLCSLMSIVGSLSHHSFTTNIFTDAKVWLNQAFHTVGSSGEIHLHMLLMMWWCACASRNKQVFHSRRNALRSPRAESSVPRDLFVEWLERNRRWW